MNESRFRDRFDVQFEYQPVEPLIRALRKLDEKLVKVVLWF